MAENEISILDIVRMYGKEFSAESDESVSKWISMIGATLSRKRFGKDYNLAVALLVCHSMKMSGAGESSLGSIADTARLASISEGGESISFAANTGNAGDADAEYRLTSYGLQFITIRNRHSVPILIR